MATAFVASLAKVRSRFRKLVLSLSPRILATSIFCASARHFQTDEVVAPSFWISFEVTHQCLRFEVWSFEFVQQPVHSRLISHAPLFCILA